MPFTYAIYMFVKGLFSLNAFVVIKGFSSEIGFNKNHFLNICSIFTVQFNRECDISLYKLIQLGYKNDERRFQPMNHRYPLKTFTGLVFHIQWFAFSIGVEKNSEVQFRQSY